jgi:hypothetical protein
LRIRKFIVAIVAMSVLTLSWAVTEQKAGFRIANVRYDITGSTREFPLSQKVEIDQDRVFATEDELRAYIADLEVKFRNQRVLESAKIDLDAGNAPVDGIVPVSLTVHTVDTWNIIALPYPKFDSNDGMQLKLKFKNYNFFGSMEELNFDTLFSVDNDGKKSIESGFDFSIPFQMKGYALNWSIESSLIVPFGEVPEFGFKTGIDLALPAGFADVHVGVEQGMSVNARDSNDDLEDDRFYLTERVYANVPYTLHEFDYVGKLEWTPEVSITQNWNADGIKDPDLTGPDFTVKHTLSIGRVDWIGNFRRGFTVSADNEYVYDLHNKDGWDISVSGTAAGYATLIDRFGFSSRLSAFRVLEGDPEEKAADKLRGILDRRITTDGMITLNIDFPVRVMRVNFEEITGVRWTKYIGFDLHASPFVDMALTHDLYTGRYYSLDDGWLSGGLEVIAYPMKMRSIYVRASVGFDLREVAESGSLRGNAERDGESMHEYFVGIGLMY